MTNPLVKMMANMATQSERSAKYAGLPFSCVRAIVKDVDDPEERGRVRVWFDDLNKDTPQVTGSGIWSESRVGNEPDLSHWIDVCPSFKGKQPPGLIDKRVSIIVSNGQFQYAVLQDVLFDPQVLSTNVADQLERPNNSSMTRLPIYPAGQLPPPCAENHGCSVIEEGGPMNSDWVCVCLKRDGTYIWVRHADLAHGHAGGNDVTMQVDSSGNRPNPGQVAATYDHVFVTSKTEMNKANRTAYSSAPAGNPWGPDAGWAPSPMAELTDGAQTEPLPFFEGDLFDQETALSFIRETEFLDDIPGSFTSAYAPELPIAVEAVPGATFAQDIVNRAKQITKVAEIAGQVSNPTQLIQQTASQIAGSTPPAATSYVVKNLNVSGTVNTVFSSLSQALQV